MCMKMHVIVYVDVKIKMHVLTTVLRMPSHNNCTHGCGSDSLAWGGRWLSWRQALPSC